MYIEIGFSKNENINIEEQLDITLNNLTKIGILKNNSLKSYSSIVMDPAYVHVNSKSIEFIEKCMKNLKANNIYSIGRYGAWTYCSMEDCMIEAKKLAEEIM